MIVKKITTGFVVQTYDTDLECCTHQEFVAGDQVDWEDEDGNTLLSLSDSTQYVGDTDLDLEDLPYQPFDMVQNLHYPKPPKKKVHEYINPESTLLKKK